MDKKIRIGMVQFEGNLGDVHSNIVHARELIGSAAAQGADIVCLPELFATGYNLSLLAEKTVSLGSVHYEYIVAEMASAAKDNRVYLSREIGRASCRERV